MGTTYKHDDEKEQYFLGYPSLQRHECVSRQDMIHWGEFYRLPVGGIPHRTTVRLLNNLKRKGKLVETSLSCYNLPDR
jgi:hypothetical protein